MLDYDKSQELMLAQEADYMKSIQEIPGLNPDILAEIFFISAGIFAIWAIHATFKGSR